MVTLADDDGIFCIQVVRLAKVGPNIGCVDT